MEICLVQEVEKFNRLLYEIDESLTDLSNAINGEIIMSEKLDLMFGMLIKSQIPKNWENVAYPS